MNVQRKSNARQSIPKAFPCPGLGKLGNENILRVSGIVTDELVAVRVDCWLVGRGGYGKVRRSRPASDV